MGPELHGLTDPRGKSYYHFLKIKAVFTKNNMRAVSCVLGILAFGLAPRLATAELSRESGSAAMDLNASKLMTW